MASVGLRELKQNPSGVVARAEAGETIVITVQGRPAARLVPLAPVRKRWLSVEDMDEITAGLEPDPVWAAEHAARPDDEDDFIDPWERAGL